MTTVIDTTSEHEVSRQMSNPTIDDAALTPLAKRGANRTIHETVSSSDKADLIGFFCECDDPNCHKVRWLEADAFERGCADPTWHVLAPGHRAAVPEDRERS